MSHDVPTCFELEPSGSGLLGGIPGCPVRFRFTHHFLERLASRWPGVSPEVVLVGLPGARVLASDLRGEYTVSVASPLFGGRMLLGVVYPARGSDPGAVAAIRTCYPEWGGGLDEPHLSIVAKRGGRLCPRRRLTEVMDRWRARQGPVVDPV